MGEAHLSHAGGADLPTERVAFDCESAHFFCCKYLKNDRFLAHMALLFLLFNASHW